MKIIDLLNKIANDEIEDGTIFEVIGDFFYKLIVIDENLYCINEITKKLELLDSKYIGRFDNRQYEIVKLSNKVEEEKKIPEKLDVELLGQCDNWLRYGTTEEIIKDNELNPYIIEYIRNNTLAFQHKINEIIDYLKSKGE